VPAVELIAAALAAGATAGATDVATTAVKDTYAELKRLVSRRPQVAETIAVLEREQAPELEWRIRLAGEITDDDAVLTLARRLLDLTGASAGPKYQVDLGDAKGVQIGDGGTQTNTFN
jgi:hypothetical protein